MDKLAAIKKAEVQGVLAALVDAELVKVANEDVFNALSDTVCENLDGDYNLNDVLEKTAAIIDAVTSEDAEPLEKEAEETDEVAEALLAHHELVLKKQAGEVSDDEFRKEATKIREALSTGKKMYTDAMTAPFKQDSTLRKSIHRYKHTGKESKNNPAAAKFLKKERAKDVPEIKKELGKSLAAYGVTGATATGAAAAGKKATKKD